MPTGTPAEELVVEAALPIDPETGEIELDVSAPIMARAQDLFKQWERAKARGDVKLATQLRGAMQATLTASAKKKKANALTVKPPIHAARDVAVAQFARRKIDDVIAIPGHLYHKRQIIFNVSTNGSKAWIEIPQQRTSFFKTGEGLGATIPFMHGAQKQNITQTNWEEPDQNEVNNDIFSIEAVAISYCGLHVKYNNLLVGDYNMPTLVSGQAYLIEDDGEILPPGLHHDITRESLLHEMFNQVSVLRFIFNNERLGGNQSQKIFNIGLLSDIPWNDFRGIKPTSGGDPSFTRYKGVDGYLWASIEQNHPLQWGKFSAEIESLEPGIIPLERVDLGAGPTVPLQIALNLKLELVGTLFTRLSARRNLLA